MVAQLNQTTVRTLQKYIQQNHDLSTDHNLVIDVLDIYYLTQLKNVRMTLPWIILTFGLVGNLFILMIFLSKSRRRTSNAFCFNALAISDLFALIFMLMSSMLNLKIVAHVSLKSINFNYSFQDISNKKSDLFE
jgi:hypothetical protein